jgi:AcrR family transcriptional regulator
VSASKQTLLKSRAARPRGLHRGAGRPTREQAELRHQELLEHALELFLEKGFEHTTIDMIISPLRMTKRTLYARYSDKEALLKAALKQAIDRWAVPVEALRTVESPSIETTLNTIARVLVTNAFSREGFRLQRIASSVQFRLPEIPVFVRKHGTQGTLDYMADLLKRHTQAGTLNIAKPMSAALVLFSMIIDAPVRARSTGTTVEEAALIEHARYCVRLFLDGARARRTGRS